MKSTPKWKLVQRRKTAGQALILIVLTFFGLLFFLGLMVDLGQIFLAKGYLRRAADAASLAAAAQFRENRTIVQMTDAADEVARMNGVAPTSVTVETCASTGRTDATLCPQLVVGNMPKKLVRVTIVMNYPLTFLTLLGFNTIQLTETSVSEAASMDVVLVIDISESMTWEGTTPEEQDPSQCNVADKCEPFHHVKDAANAFAQNILDPSIAPADQANRLAIVTFSNGWEDYPRGTQVNLQWTNTLATAQGVINNLQVYTPQTQFDETTDPGYPDPLPIGLTRIYDNGVYQGNDCIRTHEDPLTGPKLTDKAAAFSVCATTDTGGGLLMAGDQFAVQKRPEALWVVVLLTDGMANATLPTEGNLGGTGPGSSNWVYPPPKTTVNPDDLIKNLPTGYCPDGDWVSNDTDSHRDVCKDDLVSVQHTSSDTMYDADDFARDMARFVACPAASPPAGCNGVKGQSAVIFTIGLGTAVTDITDYAGVPYGASLLRWIAAAGDDGDPGTDPCKDSFGADLLPYSKNCGNYFWAQHGADLEKVFSAIYSRIFTRLTQ